MLLAPELFRAEGGIARISRLYLRAIAQSKPGISLSVIVLNDEVITPVQLQRYGAIHAELVAPCSRSKSACFKAIWRACAKDRVHVVCTHVHLSPLLALNRIFRNRLSYDVVVHGIEVWKPLSRLHRWALGRARHILSVSEYTRQTLTSFHPDLRAKTKVVPNALDPGYDMPLTTSPTNSDHPIILTVSRLAPHDWEKGIDHLIDAMERVVANEPSAELRIVGEGSDKARLQAKAAASPARDRITFLGYVDEAQLQAEFQHCTLFALPSRKEGFGLVFLEAMSFGKPCLGARAGGVPEVITPATGHLIEYGNVGAIATRIQQIMSQPWNAEKIRERAEFFSFDHFADNVAKELSTLQ